ELRQVLVEPQDVRDDLEDAVAVLAERRAERLDGGGAAAAGGDANRAGPAGERERELERPRLLVHPERRQVVEAVRDERAPEVDRLAAGTDEPHLRPVAAHVTLNAPAAAPLPSLPRISSRSWRSWASTSAGRSRTPCSSTTVASRPPRFPRRRIRPSRWARRPARSAL